MLFEGKGRIAPPSITVPIQPHWKLICREEAARRQERDNRRKDRWGQGLSENPHYTGLLTECAAADLLGLKVDFSFGYDKGYDLIIQGLKFDVKGTRGPIPQICQQFRKRCHGFIFGRVTNRDVIVQGWISYEIATSIELEPSKAKDTTHMNYKVELEDLRDFSELQRGPGKNLVRYPGGKSRLWKGKLEKLMPSGSLFAPTRYVEPMVGGGGVCLRAISRCDYKEIVIADIDKSLIDLWTCVRDYPKQLMAKVQRWMPNVDDWYKSKEKDGSISDVVESAFLKLVLHYCGHGGIGFKSGSPQGGQSQDSDYLIGCRWKPHRICLTIRHVSKLIRQAEIICCDFTEICLREGDFVFVDPPYVDAGKSLYKHSFSLDDHVRLSKWIIESPSEWVVTYDDCKLIRELYGKYRIVSVENSSGNNASKAELFITSGGM